MILISQAKVTCDDVISACDKTIEDKNKEIDISKLTIKQLQDGNELLNGQLKDTQDSLNSWYHNFWIDLSIGIVAGVVLTSRISK